MAGRTAVLGIDRGAQKRGAQVPSPLGRLSAWPCASPRAPAGGTRRLGVFAVAKTLAVKVLSEPRLSSF